MAIHELAARRVPQLRNSALTRLLTPALAGSAHVALVVCAPQRPAPSAVRDAMDALAFGETAGRVQLQPRRRTEVEGGQLGQLQSLLVQLADDKIALASDAASLRQQVDGYQEVIASLRSSLISKESLARAEEAASEAEARLASANEQNARLAARVADEEAAKASLASQVSSGGVGPEPRRRARPFDLIAPAARAPPASSCPNPSLALPPSSP